MQQWFFSPALAGVCVIALANAASGQVKIEVQVQPAVQAQPAVQVQPAQVEALRAIAMPGPGFGGGNRLTQADAVFVGRVMALEPMDIETPQVAGGPKVTYRIAVVQVADPIFGVKKGAETVRIGFITQVNRVPPNAGGGVQILPAVPPQPGQPQIQPFPGRRPFPGFNMQLQIGQDGLFTVNKHHKENFFIAQNYNSFVQRENNPGFDGQVKTAKQLSKVMGDPVASLKAESKEDRYAAAAVLINKYRSPNNPTGQPMKTEPISAEESKLILQALASGDWKVGAFNAAIPNPFELFNQLGIQQKDGYNPINVRNQQDIATAMQKWLDENNGKYVIQKMVVDPNAKVQPGVIQPGVIDPVQPQPIPIRPGIRPLPPVKIKPGQVQPPPAPVPLPAPVEIEGAPAQDAVPVQPIRREK